MQEKVDIPALVNVKGDNITLLVDESQDLSEAQADVFHRQKQAGGNNFTRAQKKRIPIKHQLFSTFIPSTKNYIYDLNLSCLQRC